MLPHNPGLNKNILELFNESLETSVLIQVCCTTDGETEAQTGREFGTLHLKLEAFWVAEKRRTLKANEKVKVNYCFGTISWCLPLCAGLSWAWECRGTTCVCLSSGISPCRRDTEGAIQAHLPHSHPTTHTELEVLHLPPTPPITLPHPTLCPRPAETVAMGSLALWLHLAQLREARVGN